MWEQLEKFGQAVHSRKILGLFQENPSRAQDFSVRLEDVLFDYSKTNIDPEIRSALIDLAEKANVASRRDAMFAGKKNQ